MKAFVLVSFLVTLCIVRGQYPPYTPPPPPPQQTYQQPPTPTYSPPPPPPQQTYKPPQQTYATYAPPPQQTYATYSPPPPQQTYKPPQQTYATYAPPPQQTYATYTPPPQQTYKPPQQTYATYAPPPQQTYATYTPPPQQTYKPPQQTYATYAPPPQQTYATYAPPPTPTYATYTPPPPTPTYATYTPPPPTPTYATYAPPAPTYAPPETTYAPPPPPPPPPQCSGVSYKYSTYKTYLNNFSPYHPYRRDAQIKYFQQNPYDVLCTQEIYDKELKSYYWNGVKSVYRYNYTAPANYVRQSCSKKCTPQEINYYKNAAPVQTCIRNSPTPYQAYVCVGQSYNVSGVSPDCNRCLGWESSKPVQNQYQTCQGTSRNPCPYPWNGAIGTIIYSKYRYSAQDWYYYQNYNGTVYSVVYAKIEYPGYPIHVFCSALPPQTQTDSAPVSRLLNWVGTKIRGQERVVILGNLYTTPGSPSYNYLTQRKYTPVITTGCSYCANNTLATSTGLYDNIWYWPSSKICTNKASYFGTGTPVQVPNRPSVPLSSNYGVTASIYSAG